MFDPMTLNGDLVIDYAWLIMGFAHPRTEVNILSKCYENPLRGKGDMEHKRD